MSKSALGLPHILAVLFLAAAAVGGGRASFAEGRVRLFTVSTEADDPAGAVFVPSGWMGDTGDVSLATDSREDPHAGATCVKVVYRYNPAARQGWAGVLWQHPENNWGETKDAGIDLSATTRLTFWARGERGGERIEEFKVGGAKGSYPDSDEAKIGPIVLTDTWQPYTIDLKSKDLSYVITGFGWATNLRANPDGCTFYLDDIRFE
ncbi:MAG: hypothetical protein ACM3L6_06405 [Deltaproteobacteria bacterium]